MIFSYDSDFVFVGHVQMSLLLLLRDNQALRFISPSDYHDLSFSIPMQLICCEVTLSLLG
jgi:hypothetical protein